MLSIIQISPVHLQMRWYVSPKSVRVASDPRQFGMRTQIVWHWHLQGLNTHIYKDLGIVIRHITIWIYTTRHKQKQKPKKTYQSRLVSHASKGWLTARKPQTLEVPTTRVRKIVSTYMVSVFIEWVHGAQWGWLIQLEAGSSSGLPWNAAIPELIARHHGGQFLQ